jgi:hypothetical protein
MKQSKPQSTGEIEEAGGGNSENPVNSSPSKKASVLLDCGSFAVHFESPPWQAENLDHVSEWTK